MQWFGGKSWGEGNSIKSYSSVINHGGSDRIFVWRPILHMPNSIWLICDFKQDSNYPRVRSFIHSPEIHFLPPYLKSIERNHTNTPLMASLRNPLPLLILLRQMPVNPTNFFPFPSIIPSCQALLGSSIIRKISPLKETQERGPSFSLIMTYHPRIEIDLLEKIGRKGGLTRVAEQKREKLTPLCSFLIKYPLILHIASFIGWLSLPCWKISHFHSLPLCIWLPLFW